MLSINKLEELLSTNGYIPIKYFVIHNYCAFIEVMSLMNSTTFMLAIPSKYKFKLKAGKNVYKLRQIEIEVGNNTADEYAGVPDSYDLEKSYTEVELKKHLIRKKENEEGNISGHLEESYKRPISVDEINKEDIKDIKNLIRQVKRLKYCIQSLSYKIMIIHKCYMCVLDKDDSVECFLMKNHPLMNNRRIFITADLELYYENVERINEDVKDILTGINKVLDRNQELHAKNIHNLVNSYNDIDSYSDIIVQKKREYDNYLNKLNTLMDTLIKHEKKLLEELKELKNSKNYGTVDGDLSFNEKQIQIQEKLNENFNVKKKIVKNINEIREKSENLGLSMDTVIFDGLVMIDRLIRNMQFIKNISLQ